VDDDGDVYVGGQTDADDFPTTPGAFQTEQNGGYDGFLSKLASNGDLVYATYFSGSGSDLINDVAVDDSGSALVTGIAFSSDFPTENAWQEEKVGDGEAFAAKFDTDGENLVYSTYLGDDEWDIGNEIAVDDEGAAYVIGQTYSPAFPSAWPIQRDHGGGSDAFVTRLTSDGEVDFSTFFGGDWHDEWGSIDVVGNGTAAIGGTTDANSSFPTTSDAFQTEPGGDYDSYVAVFDIGETEPVEYGSDPPDPTPSPDESPKPTESPSPSPTGSPTPGPEPTSPLTIRADVDVVVFGHEIHLSGDVNIPAPCSPGQIDVVRRVLGTDTFKPVGSALTTEGQWLLDVTATKTASYKAVVEATETCPGYSSRLVEVQVKAAIDIEKAGSCASAKTIMGRVRPNHAGTNVLLQARRQGDWVAVDRARLNELSRFRLTRETCRSEHRVVWRSRSKLVAGASRRL
ncbi:MAG TPA: SBBP repeat-containing protein, partial [Actinomycetota bacterium]|nr:SBBP repeat-containing protein [Actinomycetota bacterium]